MKKKLLIYAFLCASAALLNKLKAQNYYDLATSLSTYTDLVSPVVLNNDDSIAGAYYASGDVIFPVYGYDVNFNQVPSVPSLGAFITRYGYLAVYESPSYSYTMVFHAAYNSYIKRDATSSISIKYEGAQGNGILKIQWKNMGIEDKPDSNYVNFQVWFNEQNKTISYHYGPHNITGAITPFIGMFRAPNDFSFLSNASYVTGTLENPSTLTLSNPAAFAGINTVSGFPANNTVYTFSKNLTGINETFSGQNAVSVYPNPANHSLYVDAANMKAETILIRDLAGKEVLTVSGLKKGESIDISMLNSGLYWLVAEGYKPVKFVKE
jgi:hypothetical protein